MLIYPAIDLYAGQAVRLVKGDYAQLTVYSPDPVSVARDFAASGATHMHMVDLEGARDGGTPNFATIAAVKAETGLFCEVGGGVRDMATIERYVGAGIDRVILGTAATRDGMMAGTNVELYKKLSGQLELNVIASGGVSSLDDVKRLKSLGLHGAIIGKAYYTGAIDLRKAIKTAQ